MSDGREEREEQEQRRKWEKEKKDREDDLDRDWERDGERERRDSRATDECYAPYADQVRLQQIKRIGLIAYPNRLPDDYWTELGHDSYVRL